MRIQRNKTLAPIILVLVLTVTVLIMMAPAVKAATIITSAFVSAQPNVVGIGQTVVLTGDIDPNPPTGYFYHNLAFTITRPDGSEETLGPFTSDENGAVFVYYTPDQFGTYTVTFTYPGETLGDDNYTSCEAVTSFTVGDFVPPVAYFTYSPSSPVDTYDVIYFDASDSYDPDGIIVSYDWDFDDGTSFLTNSSSVTHSYVDDGNYTVTLTVTDDDGGTASASDTITVLNRLPVASFTYSPVSPTVGQTVSFDARGSTDPDGYIVS